MTATKQNASGPNIGAAIRARRRELNLTLKAVADSTNLSVGFLSQVERNLTSPSLSSLVNIASALDVSIDFFLGALKPGGLMTRRDERLFFSVEGFPVSYARVSNDLPDGKLHAVVDHIPPGFTSEETTHVGEDFLYVIKGNVWIIVGGEKYELHPGDTIHYQATVPHQWGNSGESEAVCLSIGTQPLFARRKGAYKENGSSSMEGQVDGDH